MTEKQIERYLVKETEAIGCWCLKFPPLFFRGFPDRMVLVPKSKRKPARVVFVELKRLGLQPTLIQTKVHQRLRALGFEVHVLDSKESIDTFIISL